MAKFNKTKEWLYEEYVIKNRPRKEIAEECNLTIAGLKSLLAKWDIKKIKKVINKDQLEELINKNYTRIQIEQQLNITTTSLYRLLNKYNLKIKNKVVNEQYDDSNDLLITQLYLDGFSSTEIGKELGISHRTVLNHLEKCEIPRRNLIKSHWTQNEKEYPNDFESYEIMYDLYINQKLSKKDLGIKYNCDPCVIDRVLTNLNIPIRNNSESKIGLCSGEKHWNWQGGITKLAFRLREYFNTNLTASVLKRDNYTCQLCGKPHGVLHVHHIKSFSSILHRILEEHPELDPIKDVNALYDIAVKDSEFTDVNNLITYCKECHFYKIHKYKKNNS